MDRYQQSHLLLAAIDDYDAAPEVGALGVLEPSWVFYGKRPTRELTLEPAAPSRSLSRFAPRPSQSVTEFLEAGAHRVAIAPGRHMGALRERFPGRLVILAQAPMFLRDEPLFVVTLNGAARVTGSSARVAPAEHRLVLVALPLRQEVARAARRRRRHGTHFHQLAQPILDRLSTRQVIGDVARWTRARSYWGQFPTR